MSRNVNRHRRHRVLRRQGERSTTATATEVQSSNNLDFTSDENHNRSLAFELMNEFRQSREFCDVVLRVASGSSSSGVSQPIHAHRLVLSASSPYFRAMLTGGLAESMQKQITIHEIDPEALQLLIDYFYTHKLAIQESNVQNLLAASCLLQVDDVKSKCIDFLLRQLDASNCLGMRALGDTYACRILYETADAFLRLNFQDVITTEEFLSLPLESVVEIITFGDLNVPNEETIFHAIMAWIKHEAAAVPERSLFIYKLLSRIKLDLLSGEFLVQTVSSEALIKGNELCRNLVERAKDDLLLHVTSGDSSLKRRIVDERNWKKKIMRIEKIPSETGFDRGLEIERLLGVTKQPPNEELLFIVKWKNTNEGDLIPVREVRHKFPQMVIDFFQSQTLRLYDPVP